MRAWVVASGLLAAVWAAMAGDGAAQSAAPSLAVRDAEALRGCLPPVGDATDAIDCIGLISNACQDEPGGTTSTGITACVVREERAWDVLLNDNYRATLRSLPRAAQASLRAAQRSWLATRAADCKAVSDIHAGGTAQSLAVASCRLEATANRAVWVESIRPKKEAKDEPGLHDFGAGGRGSANGEPCQWSRRPSVKGRCDAA